MPSGTSKLEIVVGGNAEGAILALYDLGYKAEAVGAKVSESMQRAARPFTALADRGKEVAASVSESLGAASERFLGVKVDAEAMGEAVKNGALRAVTGLRELASQALRTGEEVEHSARRAHESEGMFGKVGELGALAGGWLGIAFGVEELGKKFFELGGEYEQNLNLVEALTRGNNDMSMSMGQVKNFLNGNAMEFAKYGYSVTEASQAYAVMIKAHHTAAESAKVLIPALQLSRATQMDTEHATEMMSEAMNTFGLKGKDATRIADSLSQAFHTGTASMEDIEYALKYVGVQAHASGLDLQQTSALIVELSKASIKGSSAGTGLRSMLLALQAPTGGAKKALKDLGVDAYDSNGKMKNFADVVGQLHDKMDKLSPAQREMALRTIFGKNAIQAADVVISKGKTTFDEYTAAMHKSGSASEAAQAKTQGLSGAVNRMTALFSSGLEVLYIKSAPALGKALNFVVDDVMGIGKGIVWVAEKFHVVDGIKAEVSAVGDFFHRLWKSATDNGAASSLSGTFTIIRNAMGKVSGVIRDQIIPWFQKMLPTIRPIADKLGQVVAAAMDLIKSEVSAAVRIVSFLWSHFGATLLKVIEIAWKLIAGVVSGALTIIKGIFEFFSGLFSGNWSKMWRGLGDILKGAWQIVVSVFHTLLNLLVTAVTNLIPALYHAAVDLATGIFNGLSSMGGWLYDQVKNFVKDNIVNPVKNFLGINSPSRLMAEHGRWTVLGFALGIRDNAWAAAREAVAMVKKVHQAVRGTYGGVSILGGSITAAHHTATAARAAHRVHHHVTRHHHGTHHHSGQHGHHHSGSGHHRGRKHSSASGGGIHVTVYVQGNVWTERQLAKALVTDMRDELLTLSRRNGGRTGL